MSEATESCHTCYGTGGIVGDHGPEDCPDCHGDGKPLRGGNKFEWRLLEVENALRRTKPENLPDLLWLIHELRQSRKALMAILTRCQDASPEDEMAKYVRSQAMDVLALYPKGGVDS